MNESAHDRAFLGEKPWIACVIKETAMKFDEIIGFKWPSPMGEIANLARTGALHDDDRPHGD